MSKRKTRRRFNMTRALRSRKPRTGFFKIIRWSNSGTANSHLEVVGNDAVPSTDGATVFSLNNVASGGR